MKNIFVIFFISVMQCGCSDKTIVLENDSPINFSKKCGGTVEQIETGMQIQKELISNKSFIQKPGTVDDKDIENKLNPIVFGHLKKEKDLQSVKTILCNSGFLITDSSNSTYPGFIRPEGSWMNTLNGTMYVDTPFITGVVLNIVISANRSNIFLQQDDLVISRAMGASL